MVTSATSAPSVDALMQQGLNFFRRGEWIDALACFDKFVDGCATNAQALNYQARTLEALGRYEAALPCIDRCLAIDPGNVADLRNRGVILRKLGRLEEALASFEAVLAHQPDHRDVLIKHASLLNELDRLEAALASAERAVVLDSSDLDARNTRGIILDALGRYDDALADFEGVLAIQPDHVDAINNRGMILARLGQFEKASVCYDHSLAIAPDQAQARYNRSIVRLALGDWVEGFREFESRWQVAPLETLRFTSLGTRWSGQEDVTGKTVLLHHEQGYGDTLQFARYASLMRRRGARVVMAVPDALRTLMETLPGRPLVVSEGEPIPPHDYYCPLMSLPMVFGTTPETVPAEIPYLRADPERVRVWNDRLGARTRPRIGVVWSGRCTPPINHPRDMALATLQPLFALGADFISVQQAVSIADRASLACLPSLARHGETLTDFADTAALIENLDLVISVDTAVAHLAGALGKPVWLMNRYASCWRWLQQRSDSPWYPSLRLFRQSSVGDWAGVVEQIVVATQAFIAQWIAADPDPRRTIEEGVSSSGSIEGSARTGSIVVAAHSQRMENSQPTNREKVRFVCATREASEDFFAKTPLGRSLPLYRTFPRRQLIELRLFKNNTEGLATVYNTAIEESKSDPAILIFIHDDLYLSDFYWANHLFDALRAFQIVGLAGNRRRMPRQASWMYLDDQFTRDSFDNLSGVLGHGEGFPCLRELSVYGDPGQEVKLLDGVMLAVRSETLLAQDLRFDPQFAFHFYDLDFCRQAEARNIRMGTAAISAIHASAGQLGGDSWRAAYQQYLAKYTEG